MSGQARVDYWAVLGLQRGASASDVRDAWRSLVLRHHPDKQGDSRPVPEMDVRLLNEARAVLSDPKRRAEWETVFYREVQAVVLPRDKTLSRHISLDEFEPYYDSSEGDADPAGYTHPCRCGGRFEIRYEDLEDGVEVVGCGGCGEWTRVAYQAVDEEDD